MTPLESGAGEQKQIILPLYVDLIEHDLENDVAEYIQVHDAKRRFIANLYSAEYGGVEEEQQARADAEELVRIVNGQPALLARAKAAEAAEAALRGLLADESIIDDFIPTPTGEITVCAYCRSAYKHDDDCAVKAAREALAAAAGESEVQNE